MLILHIKKIPLRRIALLAVTVSIAGALILPAIPVEAIGLSFFDDDGNGGNCDLRNWDASSPRCGVADPTNSKFKVTRLKVSENTSVPKGVTSARIYFKNLPLRADGTLNTAAIKTTQLRFVILGGQFCPENSSGVNNRDAFNGGWFEDNYATKVKGTNRPAGNTSNGELYTNDFVTRFEIVDQNGGNARQLSTVGRYKRDAAACSANETVQVNVGDLQQLEGLPRNVFFVQLSAKEYSTDRNDQGGRYKPNETCNTTNANQQCDGITNSFTLGMITSGEYNNSITTPASTSSGDDYTVTIQGGHPSLDPGPKDVLDEHATYVLRFGADCSVVKNPGKKASVILYDLDSSGGTGDKIKIQILRTYTQPDGTKIRQRLKQNDGFTAGSKSGPAGQWITVPNTYAPNYSNATDPAAAGTTNNTFSSLNFSADPGDQYEMYMFDVRNNLVNQYGLPFDPIYYQYQCPNPAAIPDVSIVQPKLVPGGSVTGTAQVSNGTTVSASSRWTQRLWVDNVGGTSRVFDAGDTPLAISPSGNATYPANNGATSPSFSNITGFVPNNADANTVVCTSLFLDNFNPANTTTNKVEGISGYDVACLSPLIEGAMPYYLVKGADIAAGPGFGGNCTVDGSASIIGSNNDKTFGATPPQAPFYNGASSQLAAFALKNIKSFATGKYQVGTGAGSSWLDSLSALPIAATDTASSLAFSNQTTPIGMFDQNSWCVPDYYSEVVSDDPQPLSVSNISALGATGVTTVYEKKGDTTLSTSNIPADGRKVIIKVDGDVIITGDIQYDASASAAGIPQLQVLATGSIYVDGVGVGRLDGFYAAQGSSDGKGLFVSCASGKNIQKSSGAQCNSKSLTVNGAIAAKKLVPNRTKGDWQGTYVSKDPFQIMEPAEVFQFSPQFWLPSLTQTNGVGPWQSVTSLPPIL